MLNPATQIDAARTGEEFLGVNGQCSDSSDGPWYVGIVNGICEDVAGRYTLTSASSCQAGFDTGITAAMGGITNRADTVLTPSEPGKSPLLLNSNAPNIWNEYGVNDNLCRNDNTGNNRQKGCRWFMQDATPTPEFQKMHRNCPAGDPLVKRNSGTGRGWMAICIKAPMCSNVDGTAQNGGSCLCGTAAAVTFVPTTVDPFSRTQPTLCQANNYCIFQDLPTNNHCILENGQSNGECDIFGRNKCLMKAERLQELSLCSTTSCATSSACQDRFNGLQQSLAQCSKIPRCLITDGSAPNPNSCQCKEVECNAKTGFFCYGPTSTCTFSNQVATYYLQIAKPAVPVLYQNTLQNTFFDVPLSFVGNATLSSDGKFGNGYAFGGNGAHLGLNGSPFGTFKESYEFPTRKAYGQHMLQAAYRIEMWVKLSNVNQRQVFFSHGDMSQGAGWEMGFQPAGYVGNAATRQHYLGGHLYAKFKTGKGWGSANPPFPDTCPLSLKVDTRGPGTTPCTFSLHGGSKYDDTGFNLDGSEPGGRSTTGSILNTWTLGLATPEVINKNAGVTVVQNIWTLDIVLQNITEEAGVAVYQGEYYSAGNTHRVYGTLMTALNGATKQIMVLVSDQQHAQNVQVVNKHGMDQTFKKTGVGNGHQGTLTIGSTVVAHDNIIATSQPTGLLKTTLAGSITSVEIENVPDSTPFITTINVVIDDTTFLLSDNINAATQGSSIHNWAAGTWYHVVHNYNGHSRKSLFINGVEVTYRVHSSQEHFGCVGNVCRVLIDGPIRIGCDGSATPANCVEGTMDDVRVLMGDDRTQSGEATPVPTAALKSGPAWSKVNNKFLLNGDETMVESSHDKTGEAKVDMIAGTVDTVAKTSTKPWKPKCTITDGTAENPEPCVCRFSLCQPSLMDHNGK